MTDACNICRFVWPDNTCHAHPPVVVVGVASTVQPSWLWPAVTAEDWCGEFQAVDAPTTDTPVIVTQPVVTGGAKQPSYLSCSAGTWTNNPFVFEYQWTSDGVEISGSTSSDYMTSASDVGFTLACQVTAKNEYGSGEATSNEVGPVT